ncbi:MAG: outer membrane lipoprotein carrier protein LolA [Alphaproteobacteria bacterium]|nr:outer membrane lipoprotein carrier protein LolA [Alphaproteobacteria bacterium]
MPKYIVSLISFLIVGSASLNAAELHKQDAEKIRWVEGYFNRLKTMKASFTQVNPDGSLSRGDFYLSRPGRMRIQYAHPDKRLMVADGDMFIYADPQNDEVSRIRLQVSPAFIILKEHVSFSKDNFRVIDFSDQGETVMLTVVNDDEPEYGNLTLTFDKKPFQLKQWDIVTQNGQHTTVALSHIQKDVKLDAKLFIFGE